MNWGVAVRGRLRRLRWAVWALSVGALTTGLELPLRWLVLLAALALPPTRWAVRGPLRAP